jgi:hypothetical protein
LIPGNTSTADINLIIAEQAELKQLVVGIAAQVESLSQQVTTQGASMDQKVKQLIDDVAALRDIATQQRVIDAQLKSDLDSAHAALDAAHAETDAALQRAANELERANAEQSAVEAVTAARDALQAANDQLHADVDTALAAAEEARNALNPPAPAPADPPVAVDPAPVDPAPLPIRRRLLIRPPSTQPRRLRTPRPSIPRLLSIPPLLPIRRQLWTLRPLPIRLRLPAVMRAVTCRPLRRPQPMVATPHPSIRLPRRTLVVTFLPTVRQWARRRSRKFRSRKRVLVNHAGKGRGFPAFFVYE